jgi:Zn-dependent protease with chaperone function
LVSGVSVHSQLGPFSLVHRAGFAILVGAASYLSVLVPFPGLLARLLERPVHYADVARSHLVAWLVMMPMIPLGMGTALVLPPEPGPTAYLMLVLGSLLCFGACWGGALPLATWMRVARPAGPRLAELVWSVARRMHVSVSKVYEIALYGANAMALPLARAVLFTERSLDVLNDDEIAAICAHELGHVAEPRSVAFVRVVPVVSVYLVIASVPWLIKAEPIHWLAVGIAWLLMLLAVPPLVRRLERRADAAGLAHEDVPGIYAASLEKMGRDNLTPAVMPGRAGSHPHLYDRLVSSDRPPSYARPPAPSHWPAALVLAASLSLMVAMPIGATIARSGATEEGALVASLALLGGDGRELSDLASLRSEADDTVGAATLFSAASALRPADILAPAEAAVHWSRIERCSEARVHLEMARARVAMRPSERRRRIVSETAEEVDEICPASP